MWASRTRYPGTSQLAAGAGYARRAVSLGEFDIIYFGTDWFARNRTCSHQIAERLARRARVLYVDSPAVRTPGVNVGDARKVWRQLVALARRPHRVGDQLWQIRVPQIAFHRFPFVRRFYAAVAEGLVRRAMKHLGFTRTVSWFGLPHHGCLAKAFGEYAVVYDGIDEYAALPDVDSSFGEMEAYLTKHADQVFVATSFALEKKRRLNPTSVLAPHGVDVELFRRAADPALPIPLPARNLSKPVIGFYGPIEEWIDLGLVAALAERRPGWTFLLVGRLDVDAGKLKDLPNVVFTGPQPIAACPAGRRRSTSQSSPGA